MITLRNNDFIGKNLIHNIIKIAIFLRILSHFDRVILLPCKKMGSSWVIFTIIFLNKPICMTNMVACLGFIL